MLSLYWCCWVKNHSNFFEEVFLLFEARWVWNHNLHYSEYLITDCSFTAWSRKAQTEQISTGSRCCQTRDCPRRRFVESVVRSLVDLPRHCAQARQEIINAASDRIHGGCWMQRLLAWHLLLLARYRQRWSVEDLTTHHVGGGKWLQLQPVLFWQCLNSGAGQLRLLGTHVCPPDGDDGDFGGCDSFGQRAGHPGF